MFTATAFHTHVSTTAFSSQFFHNLHTQSIEDSSPIPTLALSSCTFTVTPHLTKAKSTDCPITYVHPHLSPRNTAANCSRDMLSPSAFLWPQGSTVSKVLWQPVCLLCRRHYYIFICIILKEKGNNKPVVVLRSTLKDDSSHGNLQELLPKKILNSNKSILSGFVFSY